MVYMARDVFLLHSGAYDVSANFPVSENLKILSESNISASGTLIIS